MRSIRKIIYFFIVFAIVLLGYILIQMSSKPKSASPTIAKHPAAADFSLMNENMKTTTLPSYNPSALKGWQVDIRSMDLTSMDLKDKGYDLMNSSFDSKTKWPQSLPEGFNPDTILDINKNPGLGIRKLHNQGITGKGINIAIIDYALLVDHIEYKDRVKMYEEIHYSDNKAQMHAPAVASIAAGRSIGVASEANLYFIGCSNMNQIQGQGTEIDFTWTAKAVDRIVEVNRSLPVGQKIRVLSISTGWSPEMKGYKEMTDAVNRAAAEGIFVISSNLFETYKDKFYFHGLDIDAVQDKDSASSYSVIPWPKWIWEVQHVGEFSKYYEREFDENQPQEILLVPIGSKTTASPTGNSDYVFYREGGWSWAIPYLAGLYALSCQVKPDVTPEVFWSAALKTGEARTIDKNSKRFIGSVINPGRLIESLKNMK